jgi:cytochrome b involved in lipid metabolism
MSEVRKHRKVTDEGGVWMVISGKVYNVTPYIEFHPGGAAELLKGAGKDGTKLFQQIHAWVNVDAMLRSCLLGVLVPEDDE